MKTLFKLLAVVALLAGGPSLAHAQDSERITSFNSAIQVAQDGLVTVTETIDVIAANEQINHGIYRDFPTIYRAKNGLRSIVSFDVTSASLDGEPVEYSISKAGNGVRVYLGDPESLVIPGAHRYVLAYSTDRQLGFFPDHDELFWNVTGNGWVFPIDQATATVSLPAGTPGWQLKASLFTGPMGSVERNGTASTSDSQGSFATSAPLAPYSGLTVLLEWPKGITQPPSQAAQTAATIRANLDYLLTAIGLALLLAYYFWAWSRFGRDAKRGTIIPLYESPDSLSPAMLNYIRHMGADKKAMTAAFISMGVKGALKVTEEKGRFWGRSYSLTKLPVNPAKPLSQEEQVLYDELFSGQDVLELKKENAVLISGAESKFKASLKSQAGNKYFKKNTGLIVLGFLLAAAVLVLPRVIMANAPFFDTGKDIIFWLAAWLVTIIISAIFTKLLTMYTPVGSKAMDAIDGFEDFLTVTEKDRLAFHNPPEQTPALFEKMLPFALALGVEHKWAEQFSSVFDRLKQSGQAYAPGWYSGYNYSTFNAAGFASHVGSSFSGAVSSASTPPGSSGGGGGSSGGGGGGGGGGGW